MDECCTPPPLNLGGSKKDDAYRRVLWVVLAVNTAMFAVEVIAGLAAGSAALQADALDFLGDALANPDLPFVQPHLVALALETIC